MRDRINEQAPNVLLQIDGGISTDNIAEVTAAGANVIVAGSAFFNAHDKAWFVSELRKKSAFGGKVQI